MGGPLILIVDDSPGVRKNLSSFLTSQGYETIECSNAVQGIERFQEHLSSLELVFMDVIMHGMQGPEAMNVMRNIDGAIPIVLMSGDTFDDLDAPFLQKPFGRAEVIELTRVLTS